MEKSAIFFLPYHILFRVWKMRNEISRHGNNVLGPIYAEMSAAWDRCTICQM